MSWPINPYYICPLLVVGALLNQLRVLIQPCSVITIITVFADVSTASKCPQTTDYLGYYYAKPVFCLKICLRYMQQVCFTLFFVLTCTSNFAKTFQFFVQVLLYLSENIFLSNFPALFNSFCILVQLVYSMELLAGTY